MPRLHDGGAAKVRVDFFVTLLLVGTIASVACVAVPMLVIQPFQPQEPRALALALSLRHAGPWIAGVCVLAVILSLVMLWKTARTAARAGLIACLLLASVGAALTHFNIFEKMFHPYESPVFGSAAEVMVDADDKVLAVAIAGDARAYPIRTMGYHHIVNDTVGGVPIAVTYCTLCHTGMVWNRMLGGRLLRFRLAGINNGNALLRDEETSSIWQQSTGDAIFGPLKGQHLELVRSNELSFALWRTEQPQGRILKPYAAYASEYDPKEWESHVEKTRTVVDTSKSGINPHQLMLGVSAAGEYRAYPVSAILAEGLIQDRIAGEPVLLVLGPDHASIRVFDGELDRRSFRFAKSSDGTAITDLETGSTWNFRGCAVQGTMAGRCLKEKDAHKDYWFDWMNHYPGSSVYKE